MVRRSPAPARVGQQEAAARRARSSSSSSSSTTVSSFPVHARAPDRAPAEPSPTPAPPPRDKSVAAPLLVRALFPAEKGEAEEEGEEKEKELDDEFVEIPVLPGDRPEQVLQVLNSTRRQLQARLNYAQTEYTLAKQGVQDAPQDERAARRLWRARKVGGALHAELKRAPDEWVRAGLWYLAQGRTSDYLTLMETALGHEETGQHRSQRFPEPQQRAQLHASLAGYHLDEWSKGTDDSNHAKEYLRHVNALKAADPKGWPLLVLRLGEKQLRASQHKDPAARQGELSNVAQQIERVLAQRPQPAHEWVVRLRMLLGICHMNMEAYARAWTIFAAVLRSCTPETAPNGARLGLAYCCHKLGQEDRAVSNFERAAECLPPGSKEVRPLLGLAAVLTNPTSGTEQEMKQKIQKGMHYATKAMRAVGGMDHTGLTLCMWSLSVFNELLYEGKRGVMQGLKDAALGVLHTCKQTARDRSRVRSVRKVASEAYYQLGKLAHYKGDFSKAGLYYREAMRSDVNNLAAEFRMAQLSGANPGADPLDLQTLRGSIQTLRRCRNRSGDNADVLLHLAKCYLLLHLSLQPTAEALERQATIHGKPAGLGLEVAGCMIRKVQSGGPAEEAGLYAGMRILRINGKPANDGNVASMLEKARGAQTVRLHIQFQERDIARNEALGCLTKLTEVASPEDAEAWGLRAILDRLDEGAVRLGVEQLRCLRVNNQFASAALLNNVGALCLRAGDLDSAAAHFRDALAGLEADPEEDRRDEEIVMRYNLGILEERAGNIDRAIAEHEAVLRMCRGFTDSRLALIRLALHNPKDDPAQVRYALDAAGDPPEDSPPSSYLPLLKLAYEFYHAGDLQGALRKAETVRDACPEGQGEESRALRSFATLLVGSCCLSGVLISSDKRHQEQLLTEAEQLFLECLRLDGCDNSYATHNVACCAAIRASRSENAGAIASEARKLFSRVREAVHPEPSAQGDFCAYNMAQLDFAERNHRGAETLYASVRDKLIAAANPELSAALPGVAELSERLAHCSCMQGEPETAQQQGLQGDTVNAALSQLLSVLRSLMAGAVRDKVQEATAAERIREARHILVKEWVRVNGARDACIRLSDRSRAAHWRRQGARMRRLCQLGKDASDLLKEDLRATRRRERLFLASTRHFLSKVDQQREEARREQERREELEKQQREREQAALAEHRRKLQEVIESVRQATEQMAAEQAAPPRRGVGRSSRGRPGAAGALDDEGREERMADDIRSDESVSEASADEDVDAEGNARDVLDLEPEAPTVKRDESEEALLSGDEDEDEDEDEGEGGLVDDDDDDEVGSKRKRRDKAAGGKKAKKEKKKKKKDKKKDKRKKEDKTRKHPESTTVEQGSAGAERGGVAEEQGSNARSSRQGSLPGDREREARRMARRAAIDERARLRAAGEWGPEREAAFKLLRQSWAREHAERKQGFKRGLGVDPPASTPGDSLQGDSERGGTSADGGEHREMPADPEPPAPSSAPGVSALDSAAGSSAAGASAAAAAEAAAVPAKRRRVVEGDSSEED